MHIYLSSHTHALEWTFSHSELMRDEQRETFVLLHFPACLLIPLWYAMCGMTKSREIREQLWKIFSCTQIECENVAESFIWTFSHLLFQLIFIHLLQFEICVDLINSTLPPTWAAFLYYVPASCLVLDYDHNPLNNENTKTENWTYYKS